jgi:hypothetical protein
LDSLFRIMGVAPDKGLAIQPGRNTCALGFAARREIALGLGFAVLSGNGSSLSAGSG